MTNIVDINSLVGKPRKSQTTYSNAAAKSFEHIAFAERVMLTMHEMYPGHEIVLEKIFTKKAYIYRMRLDGIILSCALNPMRAAQEALHHLSLHGASYEV